MTTALSLKSVEAATLEPSTRADRQASDSGGRERHWPLRPIIRQSLAALASGAGLALAAPPHDYWPLAFVALVPLLRACQTVSPLRAAALSWLAFTAAIALSCPWWTPTLMRFAGVSFPAALAIAFGFCGFQALAYAFWGGVWRWLTQRWRVSALLAAPLCMALAESLFPFSFKLYLAIVAWRVGPLIQAAEWGGPPAVSALIVLANLVLVELARAGWRPGRAVRMAAAALAIAIGLGWLRGSWITTQRDRAPSLAVGLTQPNFGVVSAERRAAAGLLYERALGDATQELSQQGAELAIWPETAWPYLLDRKLEREYPPGHPWRLRGAYSGALLFGALTHRFGEDGVYNSAVLIDQSGRVAGLQDKRRLIPFAEFIPFSQLFPETARRLAAARPDWPELTPGAREDMPRLGRIRPAPLICAEDLSMAPAHRAVRRGANLLATLGSDAWFGASAAPGQHLALSVFRAVECRRDLVRAINNGPSALVDAAGRVRARLPASPPTAGSGLRPQTRVVEARLLDTAAPGPYVIRFFPLLCLIALFLGAPGRARHG